MKVFTFVDERKTPENMLNQTTNLNYLVLQQNFVKSSEIYLTHQKKVVLQPHTEKCQRE